jgi:hypothetical protein
MSGKITGLNTTGAKSRFEELGTAHFDMAESSRGKPVHAIADSGIATSVASDTFMPSGLGLPPSRQEYRPA